jgi:hypothetical protein
VNTWLVRKKVRPVPVRTQFATASVQAMLLAMSRQELRHSSHASDLPGARLHREGRARSGPCHELESHLSSLVAHALSMPWHQRTRQPTEGAFPAARSAAGRACS